jgi:hypothetical protein
MEGFPMKQIGLIATAVILSVAVKAVAQTDDPIPPNWITATNQPCKIWNPEPQPNESVTWSGSCTDGFASGKGVLRWTENGKPDLEFDGEYANGRRNGPGVIITPDGHRVPGVWADDQPLTGTEIQFRQQ